MSARIDPASLSRADAIAFRESELARLESARLVAGIASGPLKRRAKAAASAHHANIMALSVAIDGLMPPDIAAMTDDDLMAALSEE